MDVVRLFQGITVGQKHNLIRALRNLLNFYEAQGLANRDWLDVLRMNIPKDETSPDLNFPEESEIIESLRLVSRAERRFEASCAVYNLILDSALRVTEAVRLFNNIVQDRVEVEHNNGFYNALLGYFRGTKAAYYGFFTDYTMKHIEACKKTVALTTVKTFRRRIPGKVTAPKYLRKFANDTMTSEMLNIPESVADFIQGRTPKTIGARHYMKLKRKAIQFYPRYAEYITQLRRKAGLAA
ncbi:MAG: integrase [Candidatus Bathyarchaeia archaeon]|nr:integrase [Candidatus Bathyarchaeia archaeon]